MNDIKYGDVIIFQGSFMIKIKDSTIHKESIDQSICVDISRMDKHHNNKIMVLHKWEKIFFTKIIRYD